ncbi:MAG: NADH-quinone oxidoreductase subunit A [Proteobacteria bacterium]|nr:NADH-quinone oxidoreductase subunit A [Pseudomonadota bacterium]
MLFDYANILVFVALGLFLPAMMMGLGALLRPHNPEKQKLTTYECGEEVSGNSWINFNIRFYLIALIFIVFDVEVAFIYPVVTVFRDWVADGRGLFALVEILIFVAILLAGLVYVWTKGDLAWLKSVVTQGDEPEPTLPGGSRHVTD